MWLSAVRDVAIIILAFESLIVGALLIVLLFQVRSLIRLVQEEIKPLLDSASETMNTMRGTTSFVSENVVSPVVRLYSLLAGLNGGVKALFKKTRR